MATVDPKTLPNAARERLVLAYYYVWFTKGWFDGSDTPQYFRAMEDVPPAIGAYDSHDEAVIEQHMQQCVRAGIDALAVSWFYEKHNIPTSDRPDGAYSDDILESVVEIASKHGLRTGIDLEAMGLTADRLYEALKHYLSRYTGDPRILHAEGKPVVLCWATWKLGPRVWTEVTGRLREEGLDGYYVASNQNDPEYLSFLDALEFYTPLSTTETVMEQYTRTRAAVDEWNRAHPNDPPKRFHGTAMPGFDDRLIPGRLDRDDYAHYRYREAGRYFWETFAASMAARADWLHVNSFNELAEHSFIEETTNDGDFYLRLTRKFSDTFKQAAC